VKNALIAREKVAPKVDPKVIVTTKPCVICGKPSTRLVDGEPSCDRHAELVYEDQLERYTQKNIGKGVL
jgi:hypothetical protein